MLLYHFSDKKFDVISPKFIGDNYYSKNEARVSSVYRFFCYDTDKPAEDFLQGARYRYTIDIDRKDIYNLIIDKDKLINKFENISKLLIYLSEHYTGAVYNVGFKCYIIFKDIQPISIQEV